MLRLLLALLLLAAGSLRAEVNLAKLRSEHPRLLATAADFDALKALVAPRGDAAPWFATLQRQAEAILAEPLSRYEFPDGKRLLKISRVVRERALWLGLAYRLTGEKRFAERLKQELLAAADFPDWNPPHFLDTAEMTAGVALGYDWLGAALADEERAKIRTALVEKGLRPALQQYHLGSGGFPARTNNWNQVCNGGIGLGALALADEEPELCQEILQSALASLPRSLAGFAPDGAWAEGPTYWSYATDYTVLFCAALETALGNDQGLSDGKGFNLAGDFPIYVAGTAGRVFNFADAAERPSRQAATLFWFATRFDRPGWAAWQLRTLAGATPGPPPDEYFQSLAGSVHPLDLIWGARWLAKHPRLDALPLARLFRGAEVFTMRGAWDDPRASFLAGKGGDNGVNHSHLDLGSFVFDALGQRWASDLGPDDYNLPNYFDAKTTRWSYYRCRAEGHNTLVLAPSAAPDQDPRAIARVTRFSVPQQRAVIDLTAAYSAKTARRGLALIGGKDALIQDELTLPEATDLWWFMHTQAEVTIEPGARAATLRLGGETLRATLLEPAEARFELRAAEPLDTSPHPVRQQGHGEFTGKYEPTKGAGLPPDSARKLAIQLRAQGDLRIAVLLTPGNSAPALPALVPLAAWPVEEASK